MTHKFCDKCGKRVTFDGDPEDCYMHKSRVFVNYVDVVAGSPCVYKLELDFCDYCLEEFRKSLYNDMTYVRVISKEGQDGNT